MAGVPIIPLRAVTSHSVLQSHPHDMCMVSVLYMAQSLSHYLIHATSNIASICWVWVHGDHGVDTGICAVLMWHTVPVSAGSMLCILWLNTLLTSSQPDLLRNVLLADASAASNPVA